MFSIVQEKQYSFTNKIFTNMTLISFQKTEPELRI